MTIAARGNHRRDCTGRRYGVFQNVVARSTRGRPVPAIHRSDFVFQEKTEALELLEVFLPSRCPAAVDKAVQSPMSAPQLFKISLHVIPPQFGRHLLSRRRDDELKGQVQNDRWNLSNGRGTVPTLRQLEYLVAIDDAKHFGRASAAVNVSQPTLSQQLRSLEDRLGVVLVERTGNPVQLTPIGREVAARARKVLMQVQDIRGLARRSAQGVVGTIRLGVTPTLGPYLMPTVVATLHKSNPDLRLYIREGIPDEQLAELRRGELDMLLVPLPAAGSDLYIEPLFREPLHFVAPPDHPLCLAPMLQREDLRGQPVLSLDLRHHFHRQARSICAELGAELLQDYEGTSLDSLRQMAGSGLGLAILPEIYLRSEVGGEDMICRLQIADWSATRSIAAAWRDGSAYADSYQVVADAAAREARGRLNAAL